MLKDNAKEFFGIIDETQGSGVGKTHKSCFLARDKVSVRGSFGETIGERIYKAVIADLINCDGRLS